MESVVDFFQDVVSGRERLGYFCGAHSVQYHMICIHVLCSI